MRLLRIGVPIGIAALLLTVVVIDYMPPIGGFRLPGDLGKLVIHGTKITMEAAAAHRVHAQFPRL